jgi:hypothetical protein
LAATMTAFAKGPAASKSNPKGGSNVRTHVPTKASNYRGHSIDGSFRIRAARIDGSRVVGTFAFDGGAQANERHLRPRRGRRLGRPGLRGGWSVRRLVRSWLVLVASRQRSSSRCGDPLRRTQKCPSICGPTAGACHVLVLHRAVSHPGLLGLLPVIANMVRGEIAMLRRSCLARSRLRFSIARRVVTGFNDWLPGRREVRALTGRPGRQRRPIH